MYGAKCGVYVDTFREFFLIFSIVPIRTYCLRIQYVCTYYKYVGIVVRTRVASAA